MNGMEDIDPSLVDITYHQQNTFAAGHYQQSFQPSEQPIQRYMAESDQVGPLRGYQPSISNTVASVPRTAVRMDSPTPSMYSHGITISSNATSPVGENDLIYDSAAYSPHTAVYDYNSYSQHSHSGSHFLHDLTINNDASIPQYALPPNASYNCVNMSQVQGFADLQDVYGTDEGYGGLAMQGSSNEYIEVAHQNFKSEESNSYRYSTDEGLGTSIQDSASHAAASPIDPTHDEIDADGEDDASAPPSPASDTDYAPRSKATRGSVRKGKRTRDSIDSFASLQFAKRARTTKAPKSLSQANTTKNGIACSQCPDSFPSASLLSKHTLKEHTKAFTCVFSFAGCTAVFATKNEWKRHVYSQHCNFFTWTCDIGDCTKPSGKKSSSAAIVGSNFNRKDLYTQHLRRMHTPKTAEKGGKNSPAALAWDEKIKALQDLNCHQTRNPPTELSCPLQSCSGSFSGKNTWDERMEHVGKHLESLAHARGGAGAAGREVVDQGSDQLLVDWAVREGVVVLDPSGEGYCFPGDVARRLVEVMAAQQGEGEDSEDDAEGEDE